MVYFDEKFYMNKYFKEHNIDNKILTFVTVNGDFKEYGQILDVQVYKPDPDNPKHTLMVETGEVSMFGVPSFVRSKAEGMVVDGFNEKFQMSVDFFKERLKELYPVEEENVGEDVTH